MALQHLVGPACCALIALSAAAAAQGKQDRGRLDPITETEPATKDDPNKLAADLVRMRLELQRLVIDEERLLELRIRHDGDVGFAETLHLQAQQVAARREDVKAVIITQIAAS